MTFCQMFSPYFQLQAWDVSEKARHYLSGLLNRGQRKNIEGIEKEVLGADYQSLQQFISDSPWDHRAVMEKVASIAQEALGNHRNTALYLDETSFVKKGNNSVGVKRQYCGRLGKLENCQVGVFAALGRGERVALTDFRLFLPEDWAEDAERCRKAKIPEAERRHRTKGELALEMVRAARQRGSPHQWIGGDEVYGNNAILTDQLEDEGETFLMDVKGSTQVCLREPTFDTPVAVVGEVKPRGRLRTRFCLRGEDPILIKVSELCSKHFQENSRVVLIRQTTRGQLRAPIWVCPVWVINRDQNQFRKRLLVVRQEEDKNFKYSLTNAPEDTSWERLAYMQGQRFWIEQAFQDAKSELGMAQYEVRGWLGWHHHITLVCMAQLFTLLERIEHQVDTPILSVRDITELLAYYLPRPEIDETELIRRMQTRHRARQQDILRRSQLSRN